MYTWIWVIFALLLGALLGGLGFFLYARDRFADAARAKELERQLEGYKQEVSDHFLQTADLVNNLTRSYKAVFDHLEQGAYRLVDEETLRKQLGDVDAESVRLEYIGRRNKAAVLGAGTAGENVIEASPQEAHKNGERIASIKTETPGARDEAYSRFESSPAEGSRENDPAESGMDEWKREDRFYDVAAPDEESADQRTSREVTNAEEARFLDEERT